MYVRLNTAAIRIKTNNNVSNPETKSLTFLFLTYNCFLIVLSTGNIWTTKLSKTREAVPL